VCYTNPTTQCSIGYSHNRTTEGTSLSLNNHIVTEVSTDEERKKDRVERERHTVASLLNQLV
jgi:hypothetical protein